MATTPSATATRPPARRERWVLAAWSCPAPACVLAVFWGLVERPPGGPLPARCPVCGGAARFVGWPNDLRDLAQSLGGRAGATKGTARA